MKARSRKMPPAHQLTRVSRVPACLVPMKESDEELAPPKLAARPPPFPLWRRIAAPSIMLSMTRRIRKKVYIAGSGP